MTTSLRGFLTTTQPWECRTCRTGVYHDTWGALARIKLQHESSRVHRLRTLGRHLANRLGGAK